MLALGFRTTFPSYVSLVTLDVRLLFTNATNVNRKIIIVETGEILSRRPKVPASELCDLVTTRCDFTVLRII